MVTALQMGLRLSRRGYPYFVEKPEMPRISDRFLNSVAYPYPSEAEAEDEWDAQPLLAAMIVLIFESIASMNSSNGLVVLSWKFCAA